MSSFSSAFVAKNLSLTCLFWMEIVTFIWSADMTKQGWYSLFFLTLMSALFVLFCRNVFGAENITIKVIPQVAATSLYVEQTFRVTIRVPKNKDNRLMAYTASCGEEIKSSERMTDMEKYEWYEEFTVTDNCIFQACLKREVGGKMQNFCSYVEVTTDEPP